MLLESGVASPEGGMLRLRGSGACWGGCTSTQVALMEEVCSEHGVDPRQVVYVEAHHDFLSPSDREEEEEVGEGVGNEMRRAEELCALDLMYGWKSISAPVDPLSSSLEDSSSSSAPLPSDEGFLKEASSVMRLRQVCSRGGGRGEEEEVTLPVQSLSACVLVCLRDGRG